MDVDKLNELIAEGLIGEAFKKLNKTVSTKNPYYKDLVALQSRHCKLEQKIAFGKEETETLNIEQNQILTFSMSDP